jgi:hypothetical protein
MALHVIDMLTKGAKGLDEWDMSGGTGWWVMSGGK